MELKRWTRVAMAMAVVGVGSAFGADGAIYKEGAGKFVKGDLAGAGRELVKLAPFEGEQGAKARYLLGRVHQLSGERPEALLDYEAVSAYWAGQRTDGHGKEYVQRAKFYSGAVLGEMGKTTEGIERLKGFCAGPFGNIKTSLGAEAVLRIGLLQLQGKKYAEAIETLRPLREHAVFGDRALWFTGRAVIATAPAGDAGGNEMKRGIEKLRVAAEKAEVMGKRDAEARARWSDEMLDLGDAQMVVKDFAGAAATYAAVENGISGGRPLEGGTTHKAGTTYEEAMARRVGALELAGKFVESEKLAAEFRKKFPGSVLLGGVLFREAESVYLQGCAAADGKRDGKAQLEAAIGKFARVVKEYPECEYVSAAKMDWGMALYRLGRYAEAAEVMQEIPSGDRGGELARASLVEGDCLLRTLPASGEDALSASKMLLQAERAAAALAEFARANPTHPEAAGALYKLGYVYQRIGEVLVETSGERWKMWQQARDSYDKAIARAPMPTADSSDSPLAEATFERAKVIMAQGDFTGASGELRKFASEPLGKAEVAPLALLRLGTLLRFQGKGLEGAQVLAKVCEREGALVADFKDSWSAETHKRTVGMLRYEEGLCLKEAGKWPEARALFAGLAKERKDSVEGVNSLWRMAQGDREAITSRLNEARRRVAATRKVPEKEAAGKELTEATAAMRAWTEGARPAAEEAMKSGAGEGAVRLMYEVAWGYRMLGQGEVAAMENPRIAMPGLGGAGEALQGDALAARDCFRAVIAAGDRGDLAQRETANLARQDLGEMLAQLGLVDEAMDLFSEMLERGVNGGVGVREAVRPRLRIAECLLAKGDSEGALAQVNLTLRVGGGRANAEGRYVGGEAYAMQENWGKVMDTLRPFEDDGFYAAEIGDRALMRLGESLLREKKRVEAKYVFGAVVRKYPRSEFVKEARMLESLCVVNEMVTPRLIVESLRVKRRR